MKGRGVRGRISTNSARMDCWSAKHGHGTQSIETSSEAIAKNASVERITEFSMRGSFKRMVPFYEIILSKANVCCWHIATIRCDAELGRCRGIADIEQAAPMCTRLTRCKGRTPLARKRTTCVQCHLSLGRTLHRRDRAGSPLPLNATEPSFLCFR